MTVGAVVIGLGVIAGIVLTQGQGTPSSSTAEIVAPSHTVPAGVSVDGQSMGDPSAPVTLTVYSDFQCPACDAFANQTEPQLRTDLVVPGTLRIVYHDAAFQGQKSTSTYDESVEPAAGARCAGEQGQFWEYHDWLFANQHGENEGAFTRDRLTTIAQNVGLDVTAWTSCMDTGTQQANVRQATQEAAAANVSVTPTLDVNGQTYQGAMPFEQLATIIRQVAATASPVPSASPAPSPSA